jgi:hypothetical protein
MPKKFVVRHEVVQPLDTSYRIIPLTRGQNTLVDATDYGWLNQWNWYAFWNANSRKFYAARCERVNKQKCRIWMAREILGCNLEEEADHWNHYTLDNRRNNLRKCTHQQNMRNREIQSNNTSGYIGVRWHERDKCWRASIKHNKIEIELGTFHSPEKAARTRDEMAKKLHGEFAVLNFR